MGEKALFDIVVWGRRGSAAQAHVESFADISYENMISDIADMKVSKVDKNPKYYDLIFEFTAKDDAGIPYAEAMDILKLKFQLSDFDRHLLRPCLQNRSVIKWIHDKEI